MTATQYATAALGALLICAAVLATGVRHGLRGRVTRAPGVADRALFAAVGLLFVWLAVSGRVR